MNLDDVAAALAEKLGAIPNLRVHSEVPQSVNPPAAIVGLGSGQWDVLGNGQTVMFGVLLLLSATSVRTAQKDLRDFCASTGTQSIRAALEADAPGLLLAGVELDVSVAVDGWDAPAVVNMGIDFIGLEFRVRCVD